MDGFDQARGSSAAANSAALDERLHLYRDMFEHAVWGIFQTTPDGRYLRANPALARIYGYDTPAALLEALTDIGLQLYVDPHRREAFVGLMRDNGIVSGFESQIYRRDGAIIWISESCRAVRGQGGRLLYYEGTVEEITLRKRAEAELHVAKEAAESASRAKTEFLATMSHELRTPLNAIIGFAEMMQEEVLGPHAIPAYRSYAGDIRTSGLHLLAVINDILDFVKADNGSLQLQLEPVDLADLGRRVLRFVERQAEAAGLALAVLAPPGDTAVAHGDERRLLQILLNLVGNAIKFTPAGGSIEVEIGPAQSEGEVRIAVRDTGIGIAEEDLTRVMQPFQQVDGSASRRHEGTGLGLAICDRLVGLHGGRLSLASRLGEGTVATVHLPSGCSMGVSVVANREAAGPSAPRVFAARSTAA
jgi:PAS domain S-box-containing protein